MGADRPKQYLPLAGRPVLAQTLSRLHQAFSDASLCLCLDADDVHFDASWVPFADWRRISGGAERVDTVAMALASLAGEAAENDLVLVHDVARPCVSVEDLFRLHAAVTVEPDGALLAAPVADTMKRATQDGHVLRTEPREGLWHALTPQGFRYRLLCEALEHAARQGLPVTDEASAVEALGRAPCLVQGRRDNLKITHPQDLALAERILAAQHVAATEPALDAPRDIPEEATR